MRELADADALCRQTDPDVWFPDKGGRSHIAIAICRDCVLIDACREYAMRHAVLGVWGGTTYGQRKRDRAAAGITAIRLPTLEDVA